MGRKGGTVLLLMFCAVLVTAANMKTDSKIRACARQLMKKCKQEGYKTPDTEQLATVLGSDVPAVEKNSDNSPISLLSVFDSVLGSVSPGYTRSSIFLGKSHSKLSDISLPGMIQKMSNVSESAACFLNAVVAPLAWNAVTQMEADMEPQEKYETLLSAAKTAIEMCPGKLNFPQPIMRNHLVSLLRMLAEVYPMTSEDQRNEVIKWAVDQIKEKFFNCSSSKASSGLVRCKESLEWLTTEILNLLGPYLSEVTPRDIDLAPEQQFCKFFMSSEFKPVMAKIVTIKPSLAKSLLQKIKGCLSNDKEFVNYLDRLGPLACYYEPTSQLASNESVTLLSALSNCANPGLTTLKKKLAGSINLKGQNALQIFHQLGSGAKILGDKIKTLNKEELKSLVNDSSIQLSTKQKRMVVSTYMRNDTCKELSKEELKVLSRVADALPKCIYKKVKSQDLRDPEVLEKFAKGVRKSQAVAIFTKLGTMDVTEMINLPDNVRLVASLRLLENYANVSWSQVTSKRWRRAQAIFLVEKMIQRFSNWFRNVGCVLLGVTCGQIEAVANSEVLAMAQSFADTPQCLSKAQVICVSQKLFATFESQRPEYFKTITMEELSNIPAIFLIQLLPEKVKDLPESVCAAFLDKMEMLNLSRTSLRSASLPVLTEKALSCLGSNVSSLTSENMRRLGPLLCEVPPSTLRLLKPDVLKTTLQAMASCYRFPEEHQEGLLQLVQETFGNPSTWNSTTVEEMGRLLFLYRNTTFSLSRQPGMKTALSYLLNMDENAPEFLHKTLFDLTVNDPSSTVTRRKREASANSNTNNNKPVSSDNGTSITGDPTVELITQLGPDNVYWTVKQLDAMELNTFIETVDILGSVTNYSPEQLQVLSKKAVEAYGQPVSMNETTVEDLGCICQGFTDDELMKMNFPLRSLDDISKCGWNDSQIRAVWKAMAGYNSLTPQGLDASDMVALSSFMCGLSSNEIKQLNVTAFREAVPSLSLQCSVEVMQRYKNLTVSTFGESSTWTSAVVSDLGTFIAGLTAMEFASLDVSVFSHISRDCIPLIPPVNIAALSAAKIEALGPDNALLITSEQRAAMSSEQLTALHKAIEGYRQREAQSDSKAPPLAIGGIAFFKPLLFFMLGLILL